MTVRRQAVTERRRVSEETMGARQAEATRFAAELYYTNDIVGCISIGKMAELSEFRHVARGTLEAWCARGNWPAIRREKQERIKSGIEERISQQIMQAQVKQLEQLDRLYARAMQFSLSPNGPAPKSFEGAASVALRTSQHMTEVRQQMVEQLLPKAPTDEGERPVGEDADGLGAMLPDDVLPRLSEDDARLVAHQLLAGREQAAHTEAEAGREGADGGASGGAD